MRVALVSQWYPPEVPGFIAPSMAKGLLARGHEVHVVTGVPNYPSGTVYPGYRVQWYQVENAGGLTIHRGPLYPSHDRSAVRRALNYMSFSVGSLVPAGRVPDPDVWVTNGTPVTADFAAMVYAKLGRKPHVQIIQDLWPDSMMHGGLFEGRGVVARVAESLVSRFSGWSYKSCDRVGIISPGMRDVLVRRGIASSRIAFTPNSVSDSHLLPGLSASRELKESLGLPNGRLFMYAGNFGHAQNLEQLVRTFIRVEGATLVLVGDGSRLASLRRQAQGSSNVHFVPRQDPAEIGRYMAASDVQVVSLRDDSLYRVTMPSKYQAALAAGRPVLAHAPGDVSRLVSEQGVGWVMRQSDAGAEDLKDVLQRSVEELRCTGERARRVYEDVYSSSAGAMRLEAVLNEAVAHRQSQR